MSENPPVSFGEAFRFWLKLGFISFGGPAGQIAIMHRELVERRRWISESRFLHALNYCMVIPGPEAQQLATYIGWLMHRTWGGIVAGGLFVLPSVLILIALSWIYLSFGQVPVIQGLFYGIKSAVIGLVVAALYRIGSRTLKNPFLWTMAVLAFVSVFAFNVPFPAVVAGAAVCGILGGRYLPRFFQSSNGHAKAAASSGPALIDDDTPAPDHVRFRWSRIIRYSVVGLLCWLAPMAALTWAFGWAGAPTQMAWFFTQAALVTFGGAYAVLPFVFQGAVNLYGWITPAQMIDGLALGETTPGPLIIVVTFVGFLGGWSKAVLGPDLLVWGGVLGAVIVTWFTFLPSFLFILLGGPFIESTKGNLKWSAPLTAITACVVGVIFSLALFFGYHVAWPQGLAGPFEWRSTLLAVAAAIALIVFKRDAVQVVIGSALIGLAVRWFFP